MPSNSRSRKWLLRHKWWLIVGAPLLWIVLAPFPTGLGMIYPIWDILRGHPAGRHGAQPQNLVGFWIRDEVEMYDFLGTAFYLMPDGRFAGMPGMTVRRWHFDDDRLFVDAVSRCGNCYRGSATTQYTIQLVGADRLLVTPVDKDADRGIGGSYLKVEINPALRSRMGRLEKSVEEDESFRARTVLMAIEQHEVMSTGGP
jgi:hypothetical protein